MECEDAKLFKNLRNIAFWQQVLATITNSAESIAIFMKSADGLFSDNDRVTRSAGTGQAATSPGSVSITA
jgi:hypothetical protein